MRTVSYRGGFSRNPHQSHTPDGDVHHMSACALIGIVAWVILGAETLGADGSWRESPLYRSVAETEYIEIRGEGTLDVPCEAVQALFGRSDFLDTVQQAYADLLEEGEKPEFVVEQRATGHWAYVNKRGHHSEIRELYRLCAPREGAHLVLYAEGERFFGRFRAVIEMEVVPVDDKSVSYRVKVYAYPENVVSRFFARHLGLAERFFRDKTDEMTDLVCRIGHHLLG